MQIRRLAPVLAVAGSLLLAGCGSSDGQAAAPQVSDAASADLQAEEAKKKADEEAKKKAEEEAKKKADEEAKKKADEEAKKKAEEEAKKKADEEAKKKAEEEAKKKAEEEAKKKAEEERLDPASYQQVSSRDWALVVKDPDAHVGERYVLYGHVTQFDSATGAEVFLASTDAVQHDRWFEYQNTTAVAATDASLLEDVVQKDIVKMHVEVVMSFTYDTKIGGSNTVPLVKVNIIEVLGSSL